MAAVASTDAGLRRCESTAPLKLYSSPPSSPPPSSSPSMRIDGPIEASGEPDRRARPRRRLRRCESTAPLKPLTYLRRSFSRACLRRCESTAPLKHLLVERIDVIAQVSVDANRRPH